MALLSKKTDYALLILVYLHNHGTGASAREIADEYHLSRPFVANILKELCQRGFVASHRGVKGGYVLTRSAGSITIKEILQNLEEGFQLASCAGLEHEENHEDCTMLGTCPIKLPIQDLHRRLLEVLERVTLADLIQPRMNMQTLQTVLTVKDSLNSGSIS
ncbi:Rrf2 family transcriptional regulator [Telmatocola sphagniphila]|jgi:Rrf2 family protein|uniref:Rrf2 family transcriptional regulator n=1 Tax=Telmatocola sphagniphila TaxID=1123043 RepID=A0A8E6EVI4_9BACT|nr:Rrf2 family transcriptional regulator [Telmatocola sphagniphila]QVL32770.1 Rrf2 family transcriptional regulator [Telmatocola sphagniphila]